mgnify:CR=1 FL=1
MKTLPENRVVKDHFGLVIGRVLEEMAADGIAEGPGPRPGRLEVVVDPNPAARVRFDPGPLGLEEIGGRPSSDGHQDLVGDDPLFFPGRRVPGHYFLFPGADGFHPADLMAGEDHHVAGAGRLGRGAHLRLLLGQKPRVPAHDGHLGAHG